jgi:hypothetical protein
VTFYAVIRRRKDDCAVLRHPSSELGLVLIQLPRSHLCVAGETYCPGEKAQRKSQYTRFRFHVASIANMLWEVYRANSSAGRRIPQTAVWRAERGVIHNRLLLGCGLQESPIPPQRQYRVRAQDPPRGGRCLCRSPHAAGEDRGTLR